jgi:hypothetical protein
MLPSSLICAWSRVPSFDPCSSLSKTILVSLRMLARSSSGLSLSSDCQWHFHSLRVISGIAKACIRSYSHLQARDPLACRFTQLRESGISKEEAWKLMAVEILTEAGLVAPERAEMVLGAGRGRPQSDSYRRSEACESRKNRTRRRRSNQETPGEGEK